MRFTSCLPICCSQQKPDGSWTKSQSSDYYEKDIYCPFSSFQRHTFLVQEFEHLVPCHFCSKLIFGRALHCLNCKFVCHLKCEMKVVSPCNGGTPGLKKQKQNHNKCSGRFGTYQSTGTNSSSDKSTVIYCNKSVNDYLGKMSRESAEIDIIYITERILVLTFPTSGSENAYRNSLKEVCHMLKTKHANKYKIFNVSKRRHDLCRLNENVTEFGWPEDLAPPLDRLCAICKDIENWLAVDPKNTVVIHSKGGRSRPAVVVAAYMHYTTICASDDQALDRFAMKRFSDDYVGGIAQPSQRRYVKYFSALLSGSTRINSNAIYLQQVTVSGLPLLVDGNDCHPYIKIYEKMVPLYSSGVYLCDSDQLTVSLSQPLALRGDVLLKCFHRPTGPNASGAGPSRKLLFRCQFNTCALEFRDGAGINRIIFTKEDLDEACYDRNFGSAAKVELLFSLGPHKLPFDSATSAAVDAPFGRSDSYEHFDKLHEDADQAELWSEFENTIETPVLPRRPGDSQSAPAVNGHLYASVHKANESTDSGISTEGVWRPGHHQNERSFPIDAAIDFDQLLQEASQSHHNNPGHLTNGHGNPTPSGNPHSLPNGRTEPSARAVQQNINQLEQEPPIVKVVKKRGDLNSVKTQLVQVFGTEPERSDPFEGIVLEEEETPIYNPSVSSPPPVPNPPPQVSTPIEHDEHGVRPQHSVLPAAVKRPLSPSCPTPEPQPPLIDVELVGEDRYDPQSKAFAYVPSKALTDHFKTPKKATRLVQRYEDQEGREVILPDPPAMEPNPGPTQQVRPANVEQEVIELEPEQPPPPVEQKEKKPKTRKTKFNAYRTLDDYSSDMDDLCDPDFYLSYTSASASATITKPVDSVVSSPAPVRQASAPAAPSYQSRPQQQTSPPSSQSSYANPPPASYQSRPQEPVVPDTPPPPRSAPVRPASSWSDALDNNDFLSSPRMSRPAYTQSQSVTSTPVQRRHPISSNARQHSFSSTYSDMDPDEWLEAQLERLRFHKESNDPDLRRRREQERLLLEELKHVHDDRMIARNKDEADYSVEGVGTRVIDPVEELRLEQERLQTLDSPYYSAGHRVSGPGRSATHHPYVRGKPPTPPPRERSRTPPSPRRMSPVQGRRTGRQTPPTQEIAPPPPYGYQRPVDQDQVDRANRNAAPFDHLEDLLWDSGPQSAPAVMAKRQVSAQEAVASPRSVGLQQSPKSILKKPKSSANGPVPNGPMAGTAVVQQRSTPPTDQETAQRRPPQYSEVIQNRPETPAFPVRQQGTETPQPYHPLLFEGDDPRSPGQQRTPVSYQRPINLRSPSPGSMYYGQSRASSVTSLEPMEVIHHHPVFVKDTSKYWYKPNISREDAINILKDKQPGTFIVRDSNSFPGAFGLALKVATPPPGVQTKTADGTELVRHFLIEPSTKGVKLKGCNNEPVFGSLSALVYQHSITPLALPIKLLLPEFDPTAGPEHVNAAQALLEQGAACNMTYIHCCDTESLTGPEAVRRVTDQAFTLLSQKQLALVSVHFKVSSQGITVTDNTRKLFFRRHYPVTSVTFCGLDPEDRRWTSPAPMPDGVSVVREARIFGFVARKIGSRTDNCCHLFAELEPEQPATAVVNFVTKVMMGSHQNK